MLRRSLVIAVSLLLPSCGLLSGLDALEAASEARDGSSNVGDADSGPNVVSPDDADTPDDAAVDDALPRDDAADAVVVRTSRRIFVTEAEFSGNLGGPTGADGKCEAAASAAGLGAGSWRAWLGVSGAPASDRITYEGPYERVDGQRVVASKAVLNGGQLEQAVNITEKGIAPSGPTVRVWTGTRPNGQVANQTCAGWTTDSGAFGETGVLTQSDNGWTDDIAAPIGCGGTARLYCLEL